MTPFFWVMNPIEGQKETPGIWATELFPGSMCFVRTGPALAARFKGAHRARAPVASSPDGCLGFGFESHGLSGLKRPAGLGRVSPGRRRGPRRRPGFFDGRGAVLPKDSGDFFLFCTASGRQIPATPSRFRCSHARSTWRPQSEGWRFEDSKARGLQEAQTGGFLGLWQGLEDILENTSHQSQ